MDVALLSRDSYHREYACVQHARVRGWQACRLGPRAKCSVTARCLHMRSVWPGAGGAWPRLWGSNNGRRRWTPCHAVLCCAVPCLCLVHRCAAPSPLAGQWRAGQETRLARQPAAPRFPPATPRATAASDSPSSSVWRPPCAALLPPSTAGTLAACAPAARLDSSSSTATSALSGARCGMPGDSSPRAAAGEWTWIICQVPPPAHRQARHA